ncbi:MAG: 4'-phosphopantetheinyl transferase superfamily protein [Clostridia bacterium]|nr:4'-phosphopantetheinyl transferase superfamily protein [Clostridia bacterium]
MNKVKVFTLNMPNNFEFSPVYPPLRQEEIESAGCDKVKKEKYFSWLLLEYAFSKSYSLDIKDIKFERLSNGKWVCGDCYFSITHSNNAVAVAVSLSPVGIDMESRDRDASKVEKLLSPKEREELLSAANKNDYILTKWTERESSFKLSNDCNFRPFTTNDIDCVYTTKTLKISKKEYILTVASNKDCIIEINSANF